MERELVVHVDLDGRPVLAGRLWSRAKGNKETSSFEYDQTWLARVDRFALDPALPLGRGQFHSQDPLFNAFTDPAPDRWGQTLLRRHERVRAKQAGRAPRTLLAIDFLTLVHDETRLGALRFSDPGDATFLSSSPRPVPPLIRLSRLLAATGRILDEDETDEDLQLLLAPGTSLGGARPKASVLDADQQLSIAKFPRKDDEWPITRWEAVALTLARLAAIEVPRHRLELVAKRPVLLLTRFDRRGAFRIPFMSALTAIQASDGEAHSYLEVVSALRQEGAQAAADLRQLWRRVVFNILVSNTDDHLRNHGFLRAPGGWRLAPAYDLNPMPLDVKPRVHALAIDDGDTTASLETALSVAPSFGIAKAVDARIIAGEVGAAVARWRAVAAKLGLSARECTRMETAFEHVDLKAARAMAK